MNIKQILISKHSKLLNYMKIIKITSLRINHLIHDKKKKKKKKKLYKYYF